MACPKRSVWATGDSIDQSNIDQEAIQAFVGAPHGVSVTKGVFITTSAFTQPAKDYASGIPARTILIDGYRLVSLMINYRVGAQIERSYDVVDIDEDIFE